MQIRFYNFFIQKNGQPKNPLCFNDSSTRADMDNKKKCKKRKNLTFCTKTFTWSMSHLVGDPEIVQNRKVSSKRKLQ